MLKLNPGYKHILYTDEQMNDYMNSNAETEIRKLYWKMNHIVAKADIWRYTILYNQGGIYLDIDSQINDSLDKLLINNVDGIVTAETHKNLFVQWALIFNKGHLILEETLNNILKAVYEQKFKNDHHSLTVKTYAQAIFNVSNSNNFKIDWNEINKDTDTIVDCKNTNFRIYGVDYNNFFSFKHKYNHLLRNRESGTELNSHWSIQQNIKEVYSN